MTVTGLGAARALVRARASRRQLLRRARRDARRSAGRSIAADRGRDLVVLSHRLWRQRFGADPAVVGRDVRDERPAAHGRRRDVCGFLLAGHHVDSRRLFERPGLLGMRAGQRRPGGPDSDGRRHSGATGRPGFVRLVARLQRRSAMPRARTAPSSHDRRDLWPRVPGDRRRPHGGRRRRRRRAVLRQRARAAAVPRARQRAWSSLLACVNVANLLVMRLPARGARAGDSRGARRGPRQAGADNC